LARLALSGRMECLFFAQIDRRDYKTKEKTSELISIVLAYLRRSLFVTVARCRTFWPNEKQAAGEAGALQNFTQNMLSYVRKLPNYLMLWIRSVELMH
jgi:hypothetical protein